MSPDRSHAMDHVVVVLFENRSLDNMLGHLYGPEDGKDFEGVIGRDLSNPIPEWAEHGAERKSVPYTVATDMDAPNPDSGEEYFHTNTQLYNTLDEHNRFKIGEAVTAPWNVPPAGTEPSMDGFVTDYISTFTGEVGRQPTYQEYAQIMSGYTPEQVPVLNGIAGAFGVFDHWFCEVPSQTFMNRSFWMTGTSSGFVTNKPAMKWTRENTAETLFDRLEAHGRTWKVYVLEPARISFTGWIHMPRLKERLGTHFMPFAEFERDAAAGTLPDFCLIEPHLIAGHGDYHPAEGRSLIGDNVNIAIDPPSSILAGENFLNRIYSAIKAARAAEGSNAFNTTFMIGWDEPGGTYDHVPPGAVPPPDHSAPAGECDFKFDRSGYRVPAIIVSPCRLLAIDLAQTLLDPRRRCSFRAARRSRPRSLARGCVIAAARSSAAAQGAPCGEESGGKRLQELLQRGPLVGSGGEEGSVDRRQRESREAVAHRAVLFPERDRELLAQAPPCLLADAADHRPDLPVLVAGGRLCGERHQQAQEARVTLERAHRGRDDGLQVLLGTDTPLDRG